MTTINPNIDIITQKPTTTVILITPAMAGRWLLHNKRNRPLDEVTVAKYARDMHEGRWRFTHQGIGFDTNGDITDGQHRLHAITRQEEGFTVAINVTRGLDPDAKYFVDQGRKRTPGSQLAIAGVKNYNHTAAGARLYLIWQEGLLFKDNRNRQLITAPQIQEWVAENIELVDFANENHVNLVKTDALPTVARAAFFKVSQFAPDSAVEFFARLRSGAGLEEGNPILTLRNRYGVIRRAGYKREHKTELGVMLHTWNRWRAGKTLKRATSTVWTAQNFPEPK